jgi:hypothetical protein
VREGARRGRGYARAAERAWLRTGSHRAAAGRCRPPGSLRIRAKRAEKTPMHQPTPDPRFSIYDDYRVHQPWLPSITGAPQRARVLVVGSQTSVPVLQRPY